MSTPATMHCGDQQQEMRSCPYCRAMFKPETPWQSFCSSKHRTAYDMEFGAIGTVAGVRKLKNSVSVVIHLSGPAAERALKLALRDPVRLVKKP